MNPGPPPRPVLTPTQYVHWVCGSPLPEIAAHTGRNTTKVAEELESTPTPPWVKHLAPSLN